MGAMVDCEPCGMLFGCERLQAFRKTLAADDIVSSAERPVRVQRTCAHVGLVADFHGPAGAHAVAQTSQQGIFASGDRRPASSSRSYRRSNAEATTKWL